MSEIKAYTPLLNLAKAIPINKNFVLDLTLERKEHYPTLSQLISHDDLKELIALLHDAKQLTIETDDNDHRRIYVDYPRRSQTQINLNKNTIYQVIRITIKKVNGRLIDTTDTIPYVNNKRNGTETIITEDHTYTDLDEYDERYHPATILQEETINWKDDMRDGPYSLITYDEEEEVDDFEEGQYSDDKREGQWTKAGHDGMIYDVSYYIDGRLVTEAEWQQYLYDISNEVRERIGNDVNMIVGDYIQPESIKS